MLVSSLFSPFLSPHAWTNWSEIYNSRELCWRWHDHVHVKVSLYSLHSIDSPLIIYWNFWFCNKVLFVTHFISLKQRKLDRNIFLFLPSSTCIRIFLRDLWRHSRLTWTIRKRYSTETWFRIRTFQVFYKLVNSLKRFRHPRWMNPIGSN
jgi:hypothetical protein